MFFRRSLLRDGEEEEGCSRYGSCRARELRLAAQDDVPPAACAAPKLGKHPRVTAGGPSAKIG